METVRKNYVVKNWILLAKKKAQRPWLKKWPTIE